MKTVTLSDAMARETIRRVVSAKVPPRWRRASLALQGHDGESTYSFFTNTTEGKRVGLVESFFAAGCPWTPFIAQEIPKRATWSEAARAARSGILRGTSSAGTRTIAFDERVDHAAQLVLLDLLGPALRAGTPENVIGFVPGVDPFRKVVGIMADSKRYKIARAFDIKGAFDELSWDVLDQAIDQHLGDVTPGRPRVEKPLREVLKGLARVEMRHRSGTTIPRIKGVPQGAVLSPSLLNLYLKTFDQRVIRRLSGLGCAYHRYADDMLVLGPTIRAIEEASSVLREEVARVHLRMKDENPKVCDMRNRQNPVEWLGIAFSHRGERVPRERVESKAADLLLRLRRGHLGRQGLEEGLQQLVKHYEGLVGPGQAQNAVESIRRLLRPFITNIQEPKGGISNVTRQLPSKRKDGPTRSRLSSVRDDRVGEPLQGSVTRSTCSPSMPTVPVMVTELGGTQGPNDRGSSPLSDTPLRRDLFAPTAGQRRGTDPGRHPIPFTSASGSSSPVSSGLPLAAHQPLQGGSDGPRLEPSSQSKVRARMDKFDDTPSDVEAPVANVRVRSRSRKHGKVYVSFSDVETVVTQDFDVPEDASSTEIVLLGYRLALARLSKFEGTVRLHVRNPVVHGQLFRHHRIRSPRVMKRWDELVPLLDEGVEFVPRREPTHPVQQAPGDAPAHRAG